MNNWKSCAEWPAGHIVGAEPENVTTDEHETKEHAEAVCAMLRREGLGGERCHFPVRTWVEPIEPNARLDRPDGAKETP